MTGGHGIAHSEVSTPGTTVAARRAAVGGAARRAPQRATATSSTTCPNPCGSTGPRLRVFLGSLAGETSPVRTFTPLLGAELILDPVPTVTLAVDPAFEHGLLVDAGDVRVAGHRCCARRNWATCRRAPTP